MANNWNTVFHRSALARRVARGAGANVFSQAAVICIQLVIVPVLAGTWGAERYGAWLLLFSVPSYLSLGDFGFGTAAAVRMTMENARGDRDAAILTFQNATGAIAMTSLALVITGCATIALLPAAFLAKAHLWSSEEVRTTLVLLFVYGVCCMYSTLPNGGFKSTGHYALGSLLQTLTIVAEAIIAVVLVKMGIGIVGLASGYLLTRLIAVACQLISMRATLPWLTVGVARFRWSVARELVGPAAAVMALPLAYATFLQGTAVVVGLTISTASVASFTTVRTLTRVGVQVTAIFNTALMPEVGIAYATGNMQTIRRIVVMTLLYSFATLVPVVCVLAVCGQKFVGFWTHGAISVNGWLLAGMIAVMCVNGTWQPLSNLLLAINKQSSYSYLYAIGALTAVVLTWPLCRLFGIFGVACSILLLDIMMACRVGYLVWDQIWRKEEQRCSLPMQRYPKEIAKAILRRGDAARGA